VIVPIAELVFSEDHPAAQGHFPGNPVIPGAVLLSETLRAIEAGGGVECGRCEIRSAKFFHPTRPGDRVRIEYSASSGPGVRFRCLVREATVLSGEARCSGARPD